MRVEAEYLPRVCVTHPMQAVDHVDIEIEKRMPAGIAVEGMFDETLGGFGIDAECRAAASTSACFSIPVTQPKSCDSNVSSSCG